MKKSIKFSYHISEYDIINNFIKNIDFEKIALIMRVLNWKWYRHNKKIIQTSEEIKDSCIYLLKNAIDDIVKGKHKDNFMRYESGGIVIRTYKYDQEYTIEFMFVIDEYELEVFAINDK